MTENLFNYTEPLNSSQVKADADGFFDVAIDNSTGTSNKYDFCYVKLNNKLKPSTSYTIFCEVKEYTGNIRVNIVNNYTSDKGQFIYNNVASNLGIFTFQNETRASFDDCSNSLRTYCYCSAGNSGRAKFRIAIYETEKGYFEPYNKYKIPIVVSGENNTAIYLDAPLADGESINYKADNLPDIVLNKGANTITTDTAVKPKKISAKYYKK